MSLTEGSNDVIAGSSPGLLSSDSELTYHLAMIWRKTACCCLLLGLVSAGCDLGGQYEKKFQDALANSAKQAVFESNLHASYTEVMDTSRQPVGVKLRLPRIFDNESKASTQNPMAAVAGFGGSTYTLVRMVDDPNGQKVPCAVSLMAVPKGDQKGDALGAMFAKGGATMLPNAKMEEAAFTSPSGQSVALKRLRMEMPELPLGKGGAKVENRMDMYHIDAGKSAVLVTWMTPKTLTAMLDPAIDASMGTIEVSAPPPNAGKAAPPAKGPTGCM